MNRQKTVLVVDDESDIRFFLKTALEDEGFAVSTAADGEEALREVKKLKPDLISLDLVMPKKSGIKFLYELRHNKEWARIPVVIVSGHGRDENIRNDMQKIFEGKIISGPQAYLEKPIKPADFVNIVRRELGIEAEEKPALESSLEELRDRVKNIVDMSDPETLNNALKILTERKA